MITKEKNDGTSSETDARRHRLQLDFSTEAYERLLRIRDRSEATTNAEVVRNALRLYDWFLEQRSKHVRFQIVEDDLVKEVEFFF